MSYPFVQARYYSDTSNAPVTRVVIHATVSACERGGAEANAHYFQSVSAGGSAQYVVDPGQIVQCVAEGEESYNAPPNRGSIGVELCDWQSGPDTRWSDPNHTAMLKLAAGLVRDICARHGLPVAWLTAADLLAGRHGITGHAEVSAAWHQTDHTDPGPGFPVAHFLALVANQGDDDLTPEQANQLAAVTMIAYQQQSRMTDLLHVEAQRSVPVWYQRYLGRGAGSAEVTGWVALVDQGRTLTQVETAIASSAEAVKYAKSAKAKTSAAVKG